MLSPRWIRATFALALASSVFGFTTDGRAQLVTSGIGLQSCAKLGPDLKPAEGFNHMPNALLFFWIQGYMSAANIYLLNDTTNHVDLAQLDGPAMIKLVADYCAANPDGKPISAIDKYIRDAKKIDVAEDKVFNPWE